MTVTRAEQWLRRLAVAMVCAVVIVACIWLLGVLFNAIGAVPAGVAP